MKNTSRYTFTLISPTKEPFRIAFKPADENPAVRAELELELGDKVDWKEADGLRQSLNANVSGVSYKNIPNTSDVRAGWIIGTYLVLHTLVLVGVSLFAWLSPIDVLGKEKSDLFQKLVLSACAAGLGGGVYMIGQFFQKFAYGRNNEYLEGKEIPRYILLPFSSVVLGPISFALAKAGAIAFASLSSGTDIPKLSLVALSFILGYTYHDTLNALAKFSEKIFTSKKGDDAK